MNRIQKRILSVLLTAALVFSGTNCGNLSVVSAQGDSTEETLLAEETDSSAADGRAQEDVENADSAATNDEDTTVLDETDITGEESISTSTDDAKNAETNAEEIQTIIAAERDSEAEEDEIIEEEEEKRLNEDTSETSGDCGEQGSNVTWRVDANNVLYITGTGRMKDYTFSNTSGSNANEPSPWTRFLDEIVIDEGVEYIGSYAFQDCQAKEISIANTVTEIGEGAFSRYGKDDNDNEYSIVLPESIQTIGQSAFANSFFKAITISSPVSIGVAAFSNLQKLVTIDLTYSDDAVVAASTFRDCQGLKSVVLRGNISEIEPCAFSGCYELTTIEIPDATPSIADCPVDQSPFHECAKLTTINIPNGFKNIGEQAFNKGAGRAIPITNIKLSDSTERIGWGAFGACKELTSITIPKSVTTIEESAFSEAGLNTVTFEARAEGTKLTIGTYAFSGTSLESVEIPDNTEVENGAFECATDILKKVVVGDNVILGKESVAYNPGLEEIIIGTDVTIGERAFALSNSFGGNTDVRVVIGERCSLGMYAFRDRITLSEVEIGKDVTIPDGNDPFFQCYTEDTVFKLYKGSDADTYANEKNYKNKKYFVQQARFLPDADNKDPREIVKGAASQLELELLPDSGETSAENDGITTIAKSIEWETSDDSVVTIGSDAPTTAEDKATVTIQAVGKGTCTITATCDGEIQAACEIKVLEPAAAVTADPDDGAIIYSNTEENAVALDCATQGAVIYYTTDGSEPTKSSLRYSAPITFDGSTGSVTIKAFASAEEYIDSEVSTFTYTVKKKAEGIVLSDESLTLGKDEARTLSVRFTPDGAEAETTPVTWHSDNEEVASIQADNTDSLRAVVTAKKEGTCTITAACGEFTASCEVTVTSVPRVSEVTADPASGEVESGTEVILKCATSGAAIYYTTDGSEPTEESTRYANGIVVDRDMTIKAIAIKSGYDNSVVSTFQYTIKKAEEAELEGISLDKDTLSLGLTETGTLQVSFQPEHAAPAEVTWESSDTAVVRVEADAENSSLAQITGVKAGTCTVTASCGEFTASCEVTVTSVPRVSAIIAKPSDEFAVTPGTEVTLHCATEDASIYYTLDGTVPTAASTPYTGAITLNADTTICAVALKEGYEDSPSVSLYYTVNDFVPDLPDMEKPQEGIWITEVKDQPYTGSAIKPTVYVYDGKKLLKEKTDYTVSYKNNKNLGIGQITISGKGNYTDKKTASFRIVEKNISDSDIIIEDMAYAYDQKAHKTTPVITYNGKKLKAGKDFEVIYSAGDYIEEGSYKLTIKGIGSYTGTADGVIKIVGKENLLSKAAVASIPTQQYNKGAEITLADNLLKVTLRGQTLKIDEDYVVSYVNNVNPGKASVIIKGIGAYAGTKKATFKIVRTAVDINEADCTNANSFSSMEFVKGGCMPCPILVCDGYTLREGTDYTISYKNNKKSGAAAAITVRGKGNFKGKKEIRFEIRNKDISNVSMYTPNVPYTGKANKYQSKPILMDSDGTRLKAGTDYTLAYTVEGTALDKRSNPAENTVITVQVEGKGNYSGSRTDTYVLNGTSFTTAKISILNKNYTGRAVTIDAEDIKSATIKTKSGTVPLTYGVDYEVVSYSKNIKKGTATVVLCGIGEYSGEKSVKFKIVNKQISAN